MKKKVLGTYSIAKICHVAPITVGRWIDEGKLPFFTTGGGHRRVWQEDVLKFLKAHNYPIPAYLKVTQGPSVLIVEDDASMRRILRRALERNVTSVRIDEATDGFEAGVKVSSTTPSLVILNIKLPGLDVIKVCERIRANKAFKKVRILAITGEHSDEKKQKVLKAGADGFLMKPFEMDVFLKIAKSLLNSK